MKKIRHSNLFGYGFLFNDQLINLSLKNYEIRMFKNLEAHD